MGENDSPERGEPEGKTELRVISNTAQCRACVKRLGFDPRPELCWDCLISARKPEELSENDYPLLSPEG